MLPPKARTGPQERTWSMALDPALEGLLKVPGSLNRERLEASWDWGRHNKQLAGVDADLHRWKAPAMLVPVQQPQEWPGHSLGTRLISASARVDSCMRSHTSPTASAPRQASALC